MGGNSETGVKALELSILALQLLVNLKVFQKKVSKGERESTGRLCTPPKPVLAPSPNAQNCVSLGSAFISLQAPAPSYCKMS